MESSSQSSHWRRWHMEIRWNPRRSPRIQTAKESERARSFPRPRSSGTVPLSPRSFIWQILVRSDGNLPNGPSGGRVDKRWRCEPPTRPAGRLFKIHFRLPAAGDGRPPAGWTTRAWYARNLAVARDLPGSVIWTRRPSGSNDRLGVAEGGGGNRAPLYVPLLLPAAGDGRPPANRIRAQHDPAPCPFPHPAPVPFWSLSCSRSCSPAARPCASHAPSSAMPPKRFSADTRPR
jgi:hypothetical protein